MRRVTALCAATAVALSAIATVSAAQAAPYHLIKWSGVEACQIWDEGVPTMPWPGNYAVVSATFPTFVDVLTIKSGMLASGACSF